MPEQGAHLPARAETASGKAHCGAGMAPGEDRRAPGLPHAIEVRGARVHNLKNIDVDIPLNRAVGIAGVSGSGKSSLALGVLFAEGSRRYLDALSTFTRRRISQQARAQVDSVSHMPAAVALHQRPHAGGVRSTFGTATELLNVMRLAFSRLGAYRCPCGQTLEPSLATALMKPMRCPACGRQVQGLSAEELSFNSQGACPTCQGTGVVRRVDESTLVPDENLTIDEGAVAPWGSLMWDLMKQVCGACGVRTDVPFRELTQDERDIVYHGPAEKKHILYRAKTGEDFAELDFTYFNAVRTVENALSKATDERGLKRVARFLSEGPCPDCSGSRLSPSAQAVTIAGASLADVTALTLDELSAWSACVEEALPSELRPMARSVLGELDAPMKRLMQLGLGYLSLDRPTQTLSTGELQRVQLARAVRSRTTGLLYVLDEPSIGLHPANVDGLLGIVDDLVADGNSVVMVDHDVRLLAHADHLIEIGPSSGDNGGTIIAQGSVSEVIADQHSRIGAFIAGARRVQPRDRKASGDGASKKRVTRTGDDARDELFSDGRIHLETSALHTVSPLSVDFPRGRLTCVTGVSGSGKTTLVLECLIPALRCKAGGSKLPDQVLAVDAEGIARVQAIDATPIGANVRSTVATYSGVLDDLRRAFAACPEARSRKLSAADFSYNTGSLRCPSCNGLGQISLDVQFLPDIDIVCPDCNGTRYASEAGDVRCRLDGCDARIGSAMDADTSDCTEEFASISLPELLSLTVDQALGCARSFPKAKRKLETLHELGIGYLTLGEATPFLSGGEAQRLKLASEMGRSQTDTVFVFDEPTIGLHPLDVEILLGVLRRLVSHGATVIVIEHDLDVMAHADYIVDMGPGGGAAGGRIVASGAPADVAACPQSVTGRYLAPLFVRA